MGTAGRRGQVVLFVLDAGGGHRAAANALVAAASQTGSPLELEVVALKDVLGSFDFLGRFSGRSMEDTYNALVRRRLTLFLVPMLRALQWGIRRLRRRMARQVAAFLAARCPALVVSVIPNFNAVLRDGVRAGCPGTPFVVVLTDLADFPPHFWLEPGLDRVIVGSGCALEQALAAGLPEDRISRTSGMLLHPRFYAVPRAEARAAVRNELQIGEDAFVVLLLFGGKGSPEIRPLAETLLREGPEWHVVAICGDNPGLYAAVRALEHRYGVRMHAVGFTTRVAEYMAACDVLVTKPGPGSLSEAFHRRVPVVVACDRRTIPQERYNARFVAEQGLGLVVRSWRRMPEAVRMLAEDVSLRERTQTALKALPENRAVYEALDVLEREAVASETRARGAGLDEPDQAVGHGRERVGATMSGSRE